MIRLLSHRALVALMMGVLFACCAPSLEGQARLQELRRLASETPKFPDFKQVNYSDISKSDTAVVTYFYRSSANYEEVKQFYTSTLLSRGWNSAQEEPIKNWFNEIGRRQMFKKGEFTIYLNHEPAEHSGWRFAVDYSWDRK